MAAMALVAVRDFAVAGACALSLLGPESLGAAGVSDRACVDTRKWLPFFFLSRISNWRSSSVTVVVEEIMCVECIVVLSFSAAVVMIYAAALKFSVPRSFDADPLNKSLLMKQMCAWPISHFALFALIGWFRPQCFSFVMAFGILWEVFEALVATRADGGGWWRGSLGDVVANALGFLTSVALSLVVLK
jgi:hypothetical protein